MKRMRLAFILGTGLFAAGCAPLGNKGAVVMKVSEREAHISLGARVASAGDELRFYRYECSNWTGGTKDIPHCEKRILGKGKIVGTINGNYFAASVPSEAKEGDGVDLIQG